MPPLQPGESAKTTIKRQPFATELNRQGGVKSVRHKVTASIASTTEIHKDFPVSSSRSQKMHLLAGTNIVDEFKRLSQRSRFLEDFRMRDNPQATAQRQFRNRQSRRSAQGRFQPGFDFPMMLRVFAMCRDQNIDVQQNHRDSIASSRADDELR